MKLTWMTHSLRWWYKRASDAAQGISAYVGLRGWQKYWGKSMREALKQEERA